MGNGSTHTLRLAWRAVLPPAGEAASWRGTPTIADGRLFVEIPGVSVAALEARSGRTLWQTHIQPTRSPVAENIVVWRGALYLAETGDAVSLDAATGAVRWRFRPEAQADRAHIAVDERAMYIGTGDHRVYALAIENGRVLWSTDIGPDWPFLGIVTGISRSGDTLYAGALRYLDEQGGSSAGIVTALDRRDGRVLWRYETPEQRSDVSGPPTVAGRLLLVNDLYGGAFFALDRFTRERVWRVEVEPRGFGPNAPAVVVGDRAYVGANNGYAYAVELETGRVVWGAQAGTAIGALAVCDDTVFVQNLGLVAFDRATGRKVGEMGGEDEYATSGFAVAADRVFVAGNRAVYAIAC